MSVGRVKWFNETKGYGFIEHHGGNDLFVHFRDIQEIGFRTLHEGDVVRFEVQEGDKGLQAVNVVKV